MLDMVVVVVGNRDMRVSTEVEVGEVKRKTSFEDSSLKGVEQ